MQGSCQHGWSEMGMLWRPARFSTRRVPVLGMSQHSACPSARHVRCQVRPMPGASGANCVRCTARPGRFRPTVPYRLAYLDGSRTSSPRGLSGHRAVKRSEAEQAPAAACLWRHPSTRVFRVSRGSFGGGFLGEGSAATSTILGTREAEPAMGRARRICAGANDTTRSCAMPLPAARS